MTPEPDTDASSTPPPGVRSRAPSGAAGPASSEDPGPAPSGASAPDAGSGYARVGEVEEVDAVPVLPADAALPAQVHASRGLARERVQGTAMPAVQAAAVAAGSFVAGAAVAGLVHRRHSRSPALGRRGRVGRALARGSRKAVRGPERLQIVGSRTLLVDVHLLGIPDGER